MNEPSPSNPRAPLWELTDALEFESEDLRCLFDRQTGRVVMVERSTLEAVGSQDDEELAALPDWQREENELARTILADEATGQRFIEPPDKFEFHEYRHMERFIGTIADADIADQLWQSIKGKGPFATSRTRSAGSAWKTAGFATATRR